jgi:anti-anti-sigma factor
MYVSAATASNRHLVVVDLADVSFMDASGLGTIVEADVRQRRAHGALRVTNPRPAVSRVIEITGLTRLLDTTIQHVTRHLPRE